VTHMDCRVAVCVGLPNVRFLDLQPFERLNDLLAQAIIRLANNPAQRTRMGAAGHRYGGQHLHTDAVLGRFVPREVLKLLHMACRLTFLR
jgi:hypothetical protein